MEWLVSAPWLVVAVPMLLALAIALLGRVSRPLAPVISLLSPLMTIALAVATLPKFAAEHEGAASWARSEIVSAGSYQWFSAGDSTLFVAWALDSLTAIMLLVVGVVAACVVIFSAGYMKGDRGWARYFALLSLFTGSMNLLVIASTFTTLFIGWELVGACSFLLIGFWFEKRSAAAAATKAFLTTRVGDVGLLLGIALLWSATGSETYDGAMNAIVTADPRLVTAAAICIAIGAIGKSAQFPLHAWLPDAMEGPTPVSALIHAATMVAAGVFLVVRVWPLFEAAPAAQLLLLAVGATSAFGAALVAVVQRDIKKVLAYSTISQLGFMFAALGAGAWVAAFFHLATHAAFKAMLFLASGSVIHGSGTQDLHEMGGLRKAMPVTFLTWVVGVLALAGMPVFAGFFSKDAILEGVLHAAPGVAVLLFAASTLTALYMTRATRLAFFGEPAEGLYAHESPASMLGPLLVLAVPSVALGFAGPRVAELLGHEPEPLALGVSAVAVGLAVVGTGIGWLSAKGPAGDARTASALGRLHPVLAAAYGWDGFVARAVVAPVVAFSRTLWAVADRLVADGAAEGSARLARGVGRGFSRLQSGNAQSYAAALVVGVVLMLIATVFVGR